MTAALILASVGGVLLILVLFLRNMPSFQAGIPGWAAGILSGFLLGLGMGFVLMFQLGYKWDYQRRPPGESVADPSASGTQAPMKSSAPGGGAMPAGGGPGGGMGMGGPGGPGGGMGGGPGGGMGGGPGGPGGGGGGMGGGGARTPPPRIILSTLVRKVNLLTGGVSISLTTEQIGQVSSVLDTLAQFEALSDQDAQKTIDALQSVLTDEQKAVLDSIGLPPARGQARAPSGPSAPPPDTYQNPFREEGDAKSAFEQLREKVKPKSE